MPAVAKPTSVIAPAAQGTQRRRVRVGGVTSIAGGVRPSTALTDELSRLRRSRSAGTSGFSRTGATELPIAQARKPVEGFSGMDYSTFIPGTAPGSGLRRKIPGAPPS
jgi:hypothetical protein